MLSQETSAQATQQWNDHTSTPVVGQHNHHPKTNSQTISKKPIVPIFTSDLFNQVQNLSSNGGRAASQQQKTVTIRHNAKNNSLQSAVTTNQAGDLNRKATTTLSNLNIRSQSVVSTHNPPRLSPYPAGVQKNLITPNQNQIQNQNHIKNQNRKINATTQQTPERVIKEQQFMAFQQHQSRMLGQGQLATMMVQGKNNTQSNNTGGTFGVNHNHNNGSNIASGRNTALNKDLSALLLSRESRTNSVKQNYNTNKNLTSPNQNISNVNDSSTKKQIKQFSISSPMKPQLGGEHDGEHGQVDDYTTTSGVSRVVMVKEAVVNNHTNNYQRSSKQTEDSLLLAEASVQTAKGLSSGQRQENNNNLGHQESSEHDHILQNKVNQGIPVQINTSSYLTNDENVEVVGKGPLMIGYEHLNVQSQGFPQQAYYNNANGAGNGGGGGIQHYEAMFNKKRKSANGIHQGNKREQEQPTSMIVNIQTADLFKEQKQSRQQNHQNAGSNVNSGNVLSDHQSQLNDATTITKPNVVNQTNTNVVTMKNSQQTAGALYFRQNSSKLIKENAKIIHHNQQQEQLSETVKENQPNHVQQMLQPTAAPVQRIEVVYSRQGATMPVSPLSNHGIEPQFSTQMSNNPNDPRYIQNLLHNRVASVNTELRPEVLDTMMSSSGKIAEKDSSLQKSGAVNNSSQGAGLEQFERSSIVMSQARNSGTPQQNFGGRQSIHSSMTTSPTCMQIAIFSKAQHQQQKLIEDCPSRFNEDPTKKEYEESKTSPLSIAPLAEQLLKAGARPININAIFCPPQAKDQKTPTVQQKVVQVTTKNIMPRSSTAFDKKRRSTTPPLQLTTQYTLGSDSEANQFQIVQVKDPLVLQKREIQKLHEAASGLRQAKAPSRSTNHSQNASSNGVTAGGGGKRRRNIKINKTTTQEDKDGKERGRGKVEQFGDQTINSLQKTAGIRVKIQYNGMIQDHRNRSKQCKTTKANSSRPAFKSRSRHQKHQLQTQLQSCLSMESASQLNDINNGTNAGVKKNKDLQQTSTNNQFNKGLILSRLTKQPLPMSSTSMHQPRIKSAYQVQKEHNNQGLRKTWQVVQQVSAVKSFLGATTNSNQLHQRRDSNNDFGSRLQKPTGTYTRPISGLTVKDRKIDDNSLRISQSTHFNLHGKTMALNDQESYIASLRNKKELCRLKGQLTGGIRSQTPQLIEAAFIEETASIAHQSQSSFGEVPQTQPSFDTTNNQQKQSRNRFVMNGAFKTVDCLNSRRVDRNQGENPSQQMIMRQENPSPDERENKVTTYSQGSSEATTNSMIPKLKFRHSYLRQDPNPQQNQKDGGTRAQSSCNTMGAKKVAMIKGAARSQSRQHQHRGSTMYQRQQNDNTQASVYSRSSQEDISVLEAGTTPTRMPGVSAALNQGVLPRQHRQIKQAMKIITAQQTNLDRSEIETINSKLLKQVKNVNAVHQRMKEKAELIKVETEALKEQLILRGLTDNSFKPNTSQLTEKSFHQIEDQLSQARYTHHQEVLNYQDTASNNAYSQAIGVKLILGQGNSSGGYLASENGGGSSDKDHKDLIANKIEGARKVFDAAKLRSVLLAKKDFTRPLGSKLSQRSSMENITQQNKAESPFTTTEDFFKDKKVQPKPLNHQSRVLNIFLNVDGEIRRQSGLIDMANATAINYPLHDRTSSDLGRQESKGSNKTSKMALNWAQAGALITENFPVQLSPVSQENTVNTASDHCGQSHRTLDQAYGNAFQNAQSSTQKQSVKDETSYNSSKFVGVRKSFERHKQLKHNHSGNMLVQNN